MFKLFIIPIIISLVLGSQIQVQTSPHPQLHYHTLPIYGNASLGYFYVKLFIGGPQSQAQSVIVDTGSGILAIPCSQCTNCGKKHIDPPYDPSKSQASKTLMCDSQLPYCRKACKSSQSKDEQCPFSIFYAEGSSLQGHMIEDDLKFENYSKAEQIRTFFGCTTKETNLFLTQEANGIFGLAPKRDSDLFDKMVERHSKFTGQHLQFSLCLSFNGGVMTVGAPNQRLHEGKPLVTVPYSTAQNLYSLANVIEIRIGSEVIHWGKNFGKYGIFIDSGSTFTYFPRDVYAKFENVLNKKCQNSQKCKILKGEQTKCYKLQADPQRLSQAVADFFPPFFFSINGVEVPWESKKYLLTRNIKNGEVCLGILGLDRYLLGANWMYNRDIIFDLQKKEVTIYDNVKCIEEAPDMGVYSEDPKSNLNQTIFSNSPKIVLQLIGLVCLVLSLLVCGLLYLININSKNKPEVNAEDSKVETQNEESSLMENKREQNQELEKIQIEETD